MVQGGVKGQTLCKLDSCGQVSVFLFCFYLRVSLLYGPIFPLARGQRLGIISLLTYAPVPPYVFLLFLPYKLYIASGLALPALVGLR